MARKKILLLIVEGPSDQAALGLIFSRIFSSQRLVVKIMFGDITTQKGVTPSNIISKIGNEINKLRKSEKFFNTDIAGIIHLVDTDGAYIPDENIQELSSASELFYTNTKIQTNDRAKAILRNQQKRDNINRIYSCPKLLGAPYRVFYMSCDLDHVLYNIQNSSDDEKKANSFQFSKMFCEQVSEFIKFISESSFSVCTSYEDSWDYIKKDLHSLERHTNLGIYFKELYNENK